MLNAQWLSNSNRKDREGCLVFLFALFKGRFLGVVIVYAGSFLGVLVLFFGSFLGVFVLFFGSFLGMLVCFCALLSLEKSTSVICLLHLAYQ